MSCPFSMIILYLMLINGTMEECIKCLVYVTLTSNCQYYGNILGAVNVPSLENLT